MGNIAEIVEAGRLLLTGQQRRISPYFIPKVCCQQSPCSSAQPAARNMRCTTHSMQHHTGFATCEMQQNPSFILTVHRRARARFAFAYAVLACARACARACVACAW
jgi:hypothetical protein